MRALLLVALFVYARAERASEEEAGAEDASPAPAVLSAEWQEAHKITLDKVFSCTVCDSLIENIYREIQADSAKGKAPNATGAIERMLNPTPANPGCAEWDGYTDHHRAISTGDLASQRTSFANFFDKITMKQLPHKVYGHVKAQMCHTPCGEHEARFPEIGDHDCGKCMEVVRDMSLVWTRTAKQDKNTAWMLLGDVCNDMDMRHPAHAIQGDLQSSCEEFVEEHDQLLVGTLVAAPPQLKSKFALELQGHLTEAVCVKALEVCWPREVNQELKRFASLSQELFEVGMKSQTEERAIHVDETVLKKC